jgi:hypothetical protein
MEAIPQKPAHVPQIPRRDGGKMWLWHGWRSFFDGDCGCEVLGVGYWILAVTIPYPIPNT